MISGISKYKYLGQAYTSAKAESIWNKWTDVNSWHQWDNDVEKVELEGEFIKGTKGVLFPKDGPKSNFLITEVVENRKFVNIAKLPLAKLKFDHEIEKFDQQIKVTHTIYLSGLMAPIFNLIFVRRLGLELQNSVNKLVKTVEHL